MTTLRVLKLTAGILFRLDWPGLVGVVGPPERPWLFGVRRSRCIWRRHNHASGSSACGPWEPKRRRGFGIGRISASVGSAPTPSEGERPLRRQPSVGFLRAGDGDAAAGPDESGDDDDEESRPCDWPVRRKNRGGSLGRCCRRHRRMARCFQRRRRCGDATKTNPWLKFCFVKLKLSSTRIFLFCFEILLSAETVLWWGMSCSCGRRVATMVTNWWKMKNGDEPEWSSYSIYPRQCSCWWCSSRERERRAQWWSASSSPPHLSIRSSLIGPIQIINILAGWCAVYKNDEIRSSTLFTQW